MIGLDRNAAAAAAAADDDDDDDDDDCFDDDDYDDDEEGRRGNPVPARSLLLSNSTKGAASLNVPIRRNESLSTVTYTFSSYALRRDLGFNPGTLVHNLVCEEWLRFCRSVNCVVSGASVQEEDLAENSSFAGFEF
ncbi:hypothetical protein ANN_22867 [Periplaneta americana]|uniref:Uncharacterized protein n=1 Tax=Periplaneta americana TaxID=6978 RepID=A0ABQ8SKQ5_PERAM|nr:hypothetical protein ANN_22867 [Periplaneta americana]